MVTFEHHLAFYGGYFWNELRFLTTPSAKWTLNRHPKVNHPKNMMPAIWWNNCGWSYVFSTKDSGSYMTFWLSNHTLPQIKTGNTALNIETYLLTRVTFLAQSSQASWQDSTWGRISLAYVLILAERSQPKINFQQMRYPSRLCFGTIAFLICLNCILSIALDANPLCWRYQSFLYWQKVKFYCQRNKSISKLLYSCMG